MRAGRWDEVCSGRVRYLRRWYQLSRTVPIARSEALTVRPYLATCRLIGQNVGLMHHRAALVSGAVLLENFDEQGTIRTFESSAADAGSPAAFVEDLLPLRFQLWGSHVEQFYEGYQEGHEDDREAAWIKPGDGGPAGAGDSATHPAGRPSSRPDTCNCRTSPSGWPVTCCGPTVPGTGLRLPPAGLRVSRRGRGSEGPGGHRRPGRSRRPGRERGALGGGPGPPGLFRPDRGRPPGPGARTPRTLYLPGRGPGPPGCACTCSVASSGPFAPQRQHYSGGRGPSVASGGGLVRPRPPVGLGPQCSGCGLVPDPRSAEPSRNHPGHAPPVHRRRPGHQRRRVRRRGHRDRRRARRLARSADPAAGRTPAGGPVNAHPGPRPPSRADPRGHRPPRRPPRPRRLPGPDQHHGAAVGGSGRIGAECPRDRGPGGDHGGLVRDRPGSGCRTAAGRPGRDAGGGRAVACISS